MATKHVSQVAKLAAEQNELRRNAKSGRRRRSAGAASDSQRHVGAVAAARERRYIAELAAADPAVAALNDLAAEVAAAYIKTWAKVEEGVEAQVWATYRQCERPNAVTMGTRVAQAAITAGIKAAASSKKAPA